NAGAGTLSMRYGVRGQSFSVASACAAGSHAIGVATRMIQYGDADAVLTGGGEATLTPLARASFEAAGALSATGVSRPFDERRDGFVMGEGAGILLLEDADKAAARGATVYGEVLGYGSTSDAYHLTAPEPEGRYAADAIRLALADAGRTAEQIDYVNAHGTSTPLNDLSETTAIKAALGDAARTIPVSSTKSVTGHLLGAAGAVEAIATALAMRERTLPPTVGLEQPDPQLEGIDFVPLTARPLTPKGERPVALSNSFGFGGHNVVLCLEGVAA
ncbi:MAG TPA: beta-ketoacyl synthase N-terminal-like domain-containing protein, partial [Conexibacter sp.]|nr:beta-ketoacyl synthase N-terminal-like domain-containing protein [Conexibacter sp.]